MARYLGSIPVLPVNSLLKTIIFYKDILGFGNEWFWEDKEAGISMDEINLIFRQDETFTGVINDGQHSFTLMWFVEGIEELYHLYQQKEIPFEIPLQVQPWGLREFSFKDINGYTIKVAEHKHDADDELES